MDKKGFFVTMLIAAGIVAASFVVWLLPTSSVQNNTSNSFVMPFSNPNDTLASVGNQYMVLRNEVKSQLANFSTAGQANLTQLKDAMDVSIQQNGELMQTLLNGHPSGPLVGKYVNMMSSLKNFSFYLAEIKNVTSISPPPPPSSSSTSMNLTKYFVDAEKKWMGG